MSIELEQVLARLDSFRIELRGDLKDMRDELKDDMQRTRHDIRDEMGGRVAHMELRVGEAEKKIEGDIAKVEGLVEDKLEEHARRLNSLENLAKYAMGAVTVVATIIGFFGDWIRGALFGGQG